MQEAKQFTINDKVYDNIGRITLNGSTYILTQNGSDMVLVEVKQINNELVYSIPQKDENDVQKFKGLMFADEIVNNLKRDIETGVITSKDELQKRIAKASNILEKDVTLTSALHNQGIDDFKKNLKELYAYFDEIVKQAPDLDFSNYTSKNVNDQEYFFDKTDNDSFLVNRSDRSLTEELKDKENDARAKDEKISEEEAYNKIVAEKEEIRNENVKDINIEQKSIAAEDDVSSLGLVKAAYADDVNVKGNVEKGIYMNEEGRVITTDEIKEKDVVVEGGEVNAQTKEKETEKIIEPDLSKNDENPLGMDVSALTLSDVEGLLEHKDRLTEEQIVFLEGLRVKLENEKELSNGISNSKQKRLVPPGANPSTYNPDERAAYVNLIVLCLFVQIFMLLIIVGAMFFMK